ncbi:MAG: hypothetical protein WA702_14170 [Bradyrhizobium sp.]|uniref:hypothetical protein n=1 Tax=Bradyrhizobium sp. TaxID=376 RepID=UPI003C7D4FD6
MIITRHNDNRRTGAYLFETQLTPDTIGRDRFGRVATLPVLGACYAQPLAATDVEVGRTRHDIVVVATMHNMVYGFDSRTRARMWARHLGPSVVLPHPQIGPGGYKDMEWEVGIVSTPVIDTDRGMIWAVSTSDSGGVMSHHLHQLDLATGAELKKVQISARSGNATFASNRQLQRASLLLSRNKIYMAFASYGDKTPYHGWVLSYHADTLAAADVFCTVPNGSEGMAGIWQAGEGLCADDGGNIYVLTGNGGFDPSRGNYGDCAIKLDENLKVQSFFSPFDNARLDQADLDLGSGGLMAIPNQNLVTGGGKQSWLYLMDMNDLGGFNKSGDRVLQKVAASQTDGNHHIHGTPVYWEGTNTRGPAEKRVYVWPENDQMKAFGLVPEGQSVRLTNTPVAQTTVTDPTGFPGGTSGMPGGFMTVSANGSYNGIIWACHAWNENLNQRIGSGVLRAFDATSLQQRYSSKQHVGRDDYGNLAKFAPPAVAKGQVYVASMGGIERKVTLPHSVVGTPVLVSRAQDLLVAWSGTGKHLNVMRSHDGFSWGANTAWRSGDTTDHSLALTEGPAGTLFIAWTGTDTRINVMASEPNDYASWKPKKILDERSHVGPALVWGDDRLMLAWTGTDGRLNIKFSGNGTDWSSTRTLPETCSTEPSVAFHDGQFYLLWNGDDPDRKLNLMTFDKTGSTVMTKRTYGETSDWRPALAFDADGLGRVSWTGRGNNLLNEALLSPNAVQLTYKRTFYDTASNGPALCRHQQRIFLTWAGTDSKTELNVADLSRGGVSVYGMLSGPAVA